jgi:hypothetical protein
VAGVELARQLYKPFRKNDQALACIAKALALEPEGRGKMVLVRGGELDLGRHEIAVAAFA